jgi:hypothetical protein
MRPRTPVRRLLMEINSEKFTPGFIARLSGNVPTQFPWPRRATALRL